MSDPQDLVDRLADRLGRPVGVDDRRFRAIAYSSHPDEIDQVRRISILGRKAPEEVTNWLEQLGVRQARSEVHVPSNPDLSMVARVCVPIRFRDHLLGFLWLTEEAQPLSEHELAICREAAAELAHELYRLRQQVDQERQREAAWVKQFADGGLAPGLSGPSPIAPGPLYVAIAVSVTFPASQAAPVGVDLCLTEAVERMRRTVGSRHQLAAVGDTSATVVLVANGHAEVGDHANALLSTAQVELTDLATASVWVGVGDPTPSVELLPSSVAGAVRAVQLAASVPHLGPLVTWSDLGALRLLAELVGDRDPAPLLPLSIRRLLNSPDRDLLMSTLVAYLEHAGDVTKAADDLFIHRSSLYNRLQRIQEVAGVDVHSGADRLELHLGLLLWQMSGIGGTDPPDQ